VADFIGTNLKPFFEGMISTFVDSPECQGLLDLKVRQAVERQIPRRIEIKRGDGVFIKEGVRPEVADIIQRWDLGLRVMLVGPAGSGKTTMARHAAEAVGQPLTVVSCNPEYGAGAYFGHNTINGSFLPGPVYRAAQEGHVLLFDEVDNGDASSQLTINNLLDNSGYLSVPNCSDTPMIEIHPDFKFLCAANTYGRGCDRMYVGRNQMDEAFLDRFAGGVLDIDYDDTLEEQIAMRYFHGMQILEFHRELRKRTRNARMRRVVSTRMLLAACKLAEIKERDGKNMLARQSAYRGVLVGWSEDELLKLGVEDMEQSYFYDPNDNRWDVAEDDGEEEEEDDS